MNKSMNKSRSCYTYTIHDFKQRENNDMGKLVVADEMKKLNYFPQGIEFGSIYNKKWYKVRVRKIFCLQHI